MSEISELITEIREQVLYLQELGVDAMNVQLAEAPSFRTVREGTNEPLRPVLAEPIERYVPPEVPQIPRPADRRTEVRVTGRTPGSLLTSMPSLAKRTSPLPGGARASLPTTPPPEPPPSLIPPEGMPRNVLPESSGSIEDVRVDIGNCTRCELWQGRTQIVHSTGNFSADLMFVGEAPGADEDAKGEPFVGRAGQLLTKIIEGIGLKREQVFIGNINRCRPPGNRAPTLAEAEACKPFLLREIAIVRPKVIVVLGNTATQNLLNTKVGITKLRGNFQDYFGVKVMPTFHPAYLLRDPNKKREVWEDMKKVRDYLAGG